MILIAAGVLVLGPSDQPSAEVARWVGIIAAGLDAIVAIFVIPYYHDWSLIDIALAVMVIYGLSAHFSDPEASSSRPEGAHQHGQGGWRSGRPQWTTMTGE